MDVREIGRSLNVNAVLVPHYGYPEDASILEDAATIGARAAPAQRLMITIAIIAVLASMALPNRPEVVLGRELAGGGAGDQRHGAVHAQLAKARGEVGPGAVGRRRAGQVAIRAR